MNETLFVTEAECARRLGIARSRWAELAPRYERLGMARKDPISGHRYWPAVRAFMDMHNGVATSDGANVVSTGKENPNALASSGRRPRAANRPAL